MSKKGSVAPKERINIKYTPSTGDGHEEVELPLKMLVTGDFKGSEEDKSLEEREVIQIDKHSFNSVMKESNLGVTVAVDNKLDDSEASSDIVADLKFNCLDDFSPDNIAKQVPELRNLLELREALLALKGPMGNIPAFRNKLQELISDESTRKKLEEELSLVLSDQEEN